MKLFKKYKEGDMTDQAIFGCMFDNVRGIIFVRLFVYMFFGWATIFFRFETNKHAKKRQKYIDDVLYENTQNKRRTL